MKKLSVIALVFSVLFISCKEKAKEEKVEVVTEKAQVIADASYSVNSESSTLNWKGFKPTGTHNGTVAIKEGVLKVKDGKLTGGKVVFDMNTITVLDIPADDEYNAKLVAHLKSGDFFDVENNSTSTFEITEIEGETLKGNLTIKAITKPIQFPVTITNTDSGIKLSGTTFKIDRTEFDIKFKSQKFFNDLKDKFINDEFEISFDLTASK